MNHCSDTWFIIYDYLDSQNKWNLSHTCKKFTAMITKELEHVEAKLQKKRLFNSYHYDEMFKQFYFHGYEKFKQLFCINCNYDHLLYDHYIMNKCMIDDYKAIITMFDSDGSLILRLAVEDRPSQYTDSEYTISSCIYYDRGIYEMDKGNRFEYFLNGQFIGYNYFIPFKHEEIDTEIFDSKEMEINKQINQIRQKINELILVDQIFPEIYQMIEPFDNMSCESEHMIKFIKKSSMSSLDPLLNYLDDNNKSDNKKRRSFFG